MTDSGARRSRWLALSRLAMLVAVVATGYAPPLLFELVGHDQERWVERFIAGREEVAVRVEDGGGSLPYVLPGPADAWAGGKPHRVSVRFRGPRQDYLLLLRVADSHTEGPPLLAVSLNGQAVGRIAVKPGAGRDPRDETPLRPSAYALSVPRVGSERDGDQTLVLESRGGAWAWLSTLRLFQARPAFVPRHYVAPGPPPRIAILALVVALIAASLGDPHPIRVRRAPLLFAAAGLGGLALLVLAPWPPTGYEQSLLAWKTVLGSPRVVWLGLGLGVIAVVTPARPRLALPPLLGLTAFLTGALVMVLELAGFRLLSPFFGYSLYVWGALLGVIMAALALGYVLGGWMGDRRPEPALLYGVLLATALGVLATLYAYPAIIRAGVQLSLVEGTIVAAVLLCFFPMVGLSIVSPFVIRIVAASSGVGTAAGRVYALSTAGSIVGAFGSAFVLVPALGPALAWVLAGLALAAVAAWGLRHVGGRGPLAAALGLTAVVAVPLPLRPEISVADLKGGTRVYAAESEYSHVEVIEVGKTLRLVPQLRFTHTIYDEDRVFEPVITHGLFPAFLTEPRTVLYLGMGGGALTRAYLHRYPEIRIDGVDIDPEMIRLGKRFLGLREGPHLRIFVEDARTHLRRAPPAQYDVVVADLFQGGVFIPYYTLTREFFELARARLGSGGVLAIFVARPRPLDTLLRQERYARLFTAVGNTLAAVFPAVFAYPVSEVGYYFVATREPVALETVRARLAAGSFPEVQGTLGLVLAGLQEYRADPRVAVLTDDLAPVDQLIYDAFFRQ